MFSRIVQNTYRGLLQWPDLALIMLAYVGGLYFLGRLLEALTNLFSTGGSASIIPIILLSLVSLATTTLIGIAGVIVITRIIFARINGQPMSLREAIQLRPYLRAILTYTGVYVVISHLISIAYLFISFGADGFNHLGEIRGDTAGLIYVSTESLGAAACLPMMFFVPLVMVWLLSNMLAGQVITAENLGGLAAINRSRKLVVRTFYVIVLFYVTVFALSMIFGMLMMFLGGANVPIPGVTPTLGAVTPSIVIFMVLFGALMNLIGVIFNAYWYIEARTALEEDALWIEPV